MANFVANGMENRVSKFHRHTAYSRVNVGENGECLRHRLLLPHSIADLIPPQSPLASSFPPVRGIGIR